MQEVARYNFSSVFGKSIVRIEPSEAGNYVEYDSYKGMQEYFNARIQELEQQAKLLTQRAEIAEKEANWLIDEFYTSSCPPRSLITCSEIPGKDCRACLYEAARRAVCGLRSVPATKRSLASSQGISLSSSQGKEGCDTDTLPELPF